MVTDNINTVSQWDKCVKCVYFGRGFTHSFDHGYLLRCNNGKFQEMDDCSLSNSQVFCEGHENFVFPYCINCLKERPSWDRINRYGSMPCNFCILEADLDGISGIDTTCFKCKSFQNCVCIIFGDLGTTNGYKLRMKAKTCQKFDKQTD